MSRNSARVLVAQAVKRGTLVRQPCACCGEPLAEAHHDDYAQPLAVRWLCHACHLQAHRGKRRRVTSRNHDELASSALFLLGVPYSQNEVADILDISRSTLARWL